MKVRNRKSVAEVPGSLADYLSMVTVVERITYKPGWSVTFDPLMNVLMVKVRVADPDGGKDRIVSLDAPLPSGVADQVIYETVRGFIEEIEAHERIEWLRVDGGPIWNPHPNGAVSTLANVYRRRADGTVSAKGGVW